MSFYRHQVIRELVKRARERHGGRNMDVERARKIAEALGATVYKDWEPSESTTYLMAEHTRITLIEVVLFESWKEEGKNEVYVGTDWPDFSAPEWQIKIQEAVREKAVWVDYYYRPLWCQEKNPDLTMHEVVVYIEGECHKCLSSIAQEVWENALLWLAERKGVK
jgi:hypothetical protein